KKKTLSKQKQQWPGRRINCKETPSECCEERYALTREDCHPEGAAPSVTVGKIKAQEMRRVEVHYGLLSTSYYRASSKGPGRDDRKLREIQTGSCPKAECRAGLSWPAEGRKRIGSELIAKIVDFGEATFLSYPQVWMSEEGASKMVLGQIPCSNMWFLIWMMKIERQKVRRILMKGVRMRVKKTEMMMKGEGEEEEDKWTLPRVLQSVPLYLVASELYTLSMCSHDRKRRGTELKMVQDDGYLDEGSPSFYGPSNHVQNSYCTSLSISCRRAQQNTAQDCIDGQTAASRTVLGTREDL
ncbi:hypothetical protein U0070_018712, partial [Myodes glareolus]